MNSQPRIVSIKLPSALAARSESLKEKTGISEASLLRQAIQAGIGKVEEAFEQLQQGTITEDQAVS